jgi:hypothetical protein
MIATHRITPGPKLVAGKPHVADPNTYVPDSEM